MRPQKQKYLHDPENGVFGDCYRTALACLLDMDRDNVPHYVTTMDPDEWEKDVQPKVDTWLANQGLRELAIPLSGEHSLETILQVIGAHWRDAPCMLTGTSRTGCNHVVVVCNGEIVCDPAINDSGIIGPASDGFYWAATLIPLPATTLEAA